MDNNQLLLAAANVIALRGNRVDLVEALREMAANETVGNDCITRIEQLERQLALANIANSSYDNRIRAMGEQLNAAADAIAEAKQDAGWISVADRLPENESETCSVDCLLIDAIEGAVLFGYFHTDEMYRGRATIYGGSGCTDEITHWMPAPPAMQAKEPT